MKLSSEPSSMMDAQTNWSDRTDEAMEQSIDNTKSTTNSDQGAALPASPSVKSTER
ncbi:hypothetical protein NPIL_279321, partial [Nephila pilipes]